ncbi:putative E3 ubiquitin-protein ligase TOM1-like protein [Podospora australis]|uniref:HECT-type E3 ubiquitin transferase n=1 Tax=Podospora australis TaxID=1536484 RepID=A0AAN7AL92_9PEZI|nr:putative E3 ubiquitin-protein ligase TOM1-like protein [Podospora australis]
MGLITKTMQSRHRETLSPWLKDFVQVASTTPLPLLPQKLNEFPTRWPFPRGDLYHWIPLLNRFDKILEAFNATYNLSDGPQTRDFTCELLLNKAAPVEYCGDKTWDMDQLTQLGYKEDGDCQLVIAILEFSQMLLARCGNRSIYASSSRLNDLLHTTYLSLLKAALEVGLELAQRYNASMKRMPQPHRQVSTALLANHYNIELDRVNLLAQPFVKTPLAPTAPFSDLPPTTPSASSSKAKEKTPASNHNVASMYANDLVSLVAPTSAVEGGWNGWGDLKIVYYPRAEGTATPAPETQLGDRGLSTSPATPTPLRRSSTAVSQTSRSNRVADDGPSNRNVGNDEQVVTGPRSVEIRQATVQSSSIYDLLKQCPADMPKTSRYEFLNRVRIGKALLGSSDQRQQALVVRLLAIANLVYIQPELTFIEKVMKGDNDEPRRYQLIYQLAELIHPSANGTVDTPLSLQAIAFKTLQGISDTVQSKYSDIVSALNANVNHGILLYVVRKAVATLKEDSSVPDDGKMTELDQWRTDLFAMALHIMINNRVTPDLTSNGIVEILVEILKIRSKTVEMYWSTVLSFLDTLVYQYPPGAFEAFTNASGLEAMADLIVYVMSSSKERAASGQGTKPEFQAQLVDYSIPFYHQQGAKWLLKFIHHLLQGQHHFGGNVDRALRNLVDNSGLLASLRTIMEDMRVYGSIVWTNAATLLSDFINNDPTSFAAISESGMIQSFLSALTGEVVTLPPAEAESGEDATAADSPSHSENSMLLDSEVGPQPPAQDATEKPTARGPAHGILPTTDAINIIPSVLNSISLNRAGLKMVKSSKSFRHFLGIFLSPAHVQVMAKSDLDLASNIGSSFDELARHHPELISTIQDAVLGITKAALQFANTKAQVDGWGAKLLINDPEGKPVPADDSLLTRAGLSSSTRKGKEKASGDDNDVEMVDATVTPLDVAKSAQNLESSAESSMDTEKEIAPYIWSLGSFLSVLFGNNNHLKNSFIREGGIEILLDLSESPSLPVDFDSSPASRILTQVISQLIESSPLLGITSVVNRIDDALRDLQPLLAREGVEYPFFAPFIVPGLSLQSAEGAWDLPVVRKVASGTKIVKALVRLHSLVKTLYQSFPYTPRHPSVQLPGCNAFDLFERLIKQLGPLLRDTITEDLSMATLVPQHWSRGKPLTQDGSEILSLPESTPAQPPAQPESGSGTPATVPQGEGTRLSVLSRQLTPEEKSTTRFQNYEAIHGLLHGTMPNILPFFQTIGKALLPRRLESFSRTRHFRIADALVETVLEQLKPTQEKLGAKEFQQWIMMFHGLHEMLIDMSRQADRATGSTAIQLILPVLLAFKEHGGIKHLNDMLEKFAKDIVEGSSDGEDSLRVRQASVGMKKILELYYLLVNGKNVSDSAGQGSLLARPSNSDRTRDQRDASHQLVVELRLAILPVIRRLWESDIAEKVGTSVLSKVIDILQIIAAADHESGARRKTDKNVPVTFAKSPERVSFPWPAHANAIKSLVRQGYDEELSREAIYRANGKLEDAETYCRVFSAKSDGKRLALRRNAVPEEDAYRPPPEPKPEPSLSNPVPSASPSNAQAAEPMAVDSGQGVVENAIGDSIHGDAGDNSSDDSNDTSNESSSQHSDSREASAAPTAPTQQAAAASASAPDPSTATSTSKDDLDKERAELSNDLIDKCLDVIRAHPDLVFEISDLVQNMILKSNDEEKRTEVGEVLANALMSFAMDDENDKKANGASIAAYAHLLSLLLQDRSFFKSTLPTLKQNIADYLGFLRLSPAAKNDELPPWMAYILLMFETLLIDEEQPVEVKWTPPSKPEDPVEQPIWTVKEPTLSGDDRSTLLAAILDILPRIGKEESLAVSALRILVILTRDHTVAKKVGEKQNLQRLFVMAKQLCSGGSSQMNRSHISDYIMTILRHIVEDEEILRQLMLTRIRQYIVDPPRNSRSFDIKSYLSNLAHVVLRSPKLFVETTTQVVKLTRWTFSSGPNEVPRSSYSLTYKAPEKDATPKDNSVEPTVQATEDLTINDVKPSTETKDKEKEKDMADAPKAPHELKRPVLENPDGVVHFLLCELLNYRDVEDMEIPSQPSKESKPTGEASATEEEATPAPTDDEAPEQKKEDKKSPKATFRSEDHPLFVYRCFLLSCLAELLESFTRTKVEFINFKRSAPMQTNTPIKPRSSVLNYLLNDLLCYTQSSSPSELVSVKKKAAISSHAQNVLVALVSFTNEKYFEHSRSSFEYDNDPDLLFVRRFVLDTVLRAYKEASALGEAFDVRYPRMLCLAELMSQMIGDGDSKNAALGGSPEMASGVIRSQRQITRLMYEKGYLAALTASIADVDLTFPDVKRTLKHILRVLKVLTKTAFQLSQTDFISSTTTDQPEDDFASSSSLSDLDDDREETPDLYRNSTLGMLEPGREDDYYSADEEDDDDEMYDEEVYEDELDYGEEMSQDEEDNPSDEEELGEMGTIEGLPGEPGVVEVMMGDDDDEDEDMDEDEDDEDEDEDDENEMDSDDMEDIEDGIEIMDEEGNAMDDDGASGWESDTDEEDEEDEEELDYQAEAQGLQGAAAVQAQQAQRAREELNQLTHILGMNPVDGDFDDGDLDGEDDDGFDERGFNDFDDEEDEEVEDEEEEEEMYYDPSRPPQMMMHGMPAGMGFDLSLDQLHRIRGHSAFRSPFPAPFAMGGYRDPLGAGRFPFTLRHGNLLLDNEAQLLDETSDMGRSMDRFIRNMTGLISTRLNADTITPPDFRSYIRQNPREANVEDNINPLLLPSNRPGRDPSPRATSQHLLRLGIPGALMGHSMDSPLAFISDLMHTIPPHRVGGPALSLQLTQEGPHGEIRQVNIPLNSFAPNREGNWEPRRDVYTEPIQAVQFSLSNTAVRWKEEAKLLFGHQGQFDKVLVFFNAVLGSLAPAAIQVAKETKAREEEEKRKQDAERKKREEEERKEREAKEAEEKAAREKKEAEELLERQRQELEQRQREEELARAQAEAVRVAAELMETPPSQPAPEEAQAMEGVESHEAPANEQQAEAAPTERIITTIRNGETVDVTDLGIDPEYLAALPEEFREEVIAQTVSMRRSQAREQAAVEGENTEVFAEFLEALPAELREEIRAQERQERRRREREEARSRQNASAGTQNIETADMDPASILLTFPPALREQVLAEQGEDLMEHLPPELAAEARALAQRANAHFRAPPAATRTPRPAAETSDAPPVDKTQKRTVVQMLDKAGVATLLRLMFITQQGSIRNYLFDVFSPVCENRQNRLEVVSTLLQILQDGSTDMDAVERSFGQLSLRARQPKEKDVSKTPQSLKRTYTNISAHNHITSNSEVSPLLIVQQCLDLLQDLASKNPHIPSLFLTEHETVASSLKRSLSRKGKGKDANSKAQKYAINSLLGLLDRPLVMQSAQVMQLLADLLNKITYPLQALERRRKEAEEEAKRQAEAKDKGKKPADGAEGASQSAETVAANASGTQDTPQQPKETPASTSAPDQLAAPEREEAQGTQPGEASTATKESKPEEKKIRQLTPPTIPDHNLKLVVNIFVARECSSKTFQNTISTIKNLSNIPGAKNVFGEELVRQARELSENIVADLNELLPHILKAESGTEIQGVALAKFSPGASEQNKLLRVLTALDHLFDSKSKKSDAAPASSKENTKEDLLGSLYWNSTFITMWDKLSACLSVIRQRENMLNVATILLPLIESLMVVCKNTTLTEATASQAASGKEMLLSSPPPENRIAGLFFTFTEDHRRILNELVRHNPKLMSGTFSLLVKNPKVLEFDNKRNYFNRSVHSKIGQQDRRSGQHPSLQLSVRREHVFHDSFKALYFKSGDEMKFGKLNVRFHGEEGVDAGGVTREWFQALSRQMFDPNYALFIPVSSDRTTFHPNKLSSINEEHLMFFKFIGRVIGKALFENRLLDCYFSRAVYKRILGKPVSVKDMESFDPDYYKSLAWMLENDITDILSETFSVEDDEFGVTKVVDLIENGRNIAVTEENKHEYVRLIVEHKLLTSVKDQMENFLKGFHDIIPEELIAIFNEQELELLISGLPDIDVDDWKSNTEYHNYTAASQQIQWFWRAVRSFDKEEQAKLLQFVTGTSKVPLNGFKELEGMNGVSRFNIHRDYGNKERLPSSHTCFNQLDLPEYESYEMLRKQLLQAITAGSDYFGFA